MTPAPISFDDGKPESEDLGGNIGSLPAAPESIPKQDVVVVKKGIFRGILAGAVVSGIVAAFLLGYLLGTANSSSILSAVQTTISNQTKLTESLASGSSPSLQKITKVTVQNAPVRGNQDAPLLVIEYSDFQCPYCKQFASYSYPSLIKDYIDTGKAKLVYQNFPIISLHPNSVLAALAAECAQEQNKFWDYHDILFGKQSEWASLSNAMANTKFKSYAAQIGLDTNQFANCIDSQKYSDTVNRDIQNAQALGVSATPTFLVGSGKFGFTPVVGSQPYYVFQQLLDKAAN